MVDVIVAGGASVVVLKLKKYLWDSGFFGGLVGFVVRNCVPGFPHCHLLPREDLHEKIVTKVSYFKKQSFFQVQFLSSLPV